jgi:hypothetical protein
MASVVRRTSRDHARRGPASWRSALEPMSDGVAEIGEAARRDREGHAADRCADRRSLIADR